MMLKEICLKNAIKNTLSLNHFKEEPSQGPGEICMQFLQPAYQLMAPEGILHLGFIRSSKLQLRQTNMVQFMVDQRIIKKRPIFPK